MIRVPPSPLTFALLGALVATGCSNPAPADVAAPTAPATDATAPAHPDIFRFRMGALEGAALKDGDMDLPNDNSVFAVGRPVADVSALLADAGLPTDALRLSIQPLLVRGDGGLWLFDTGAAAASFARGGRLPQSLRDAGVEPAQVTDVFISHGHADHVGGLLTTDGAPAFPNAAIHIAAAEWAALQESPQHAALVAAIAPRVATFEPGAVLVPDHVTAVAVDGHTPGHTAYAITSGEQSLLYVGDSMHHHVVSVRQPDWTVSFDGDAPTAQASRRALLQRAADQKLRLYSVHFPFPGLGHVRAEGDGFAWIPGD